MSNLAISNETPSGQQIHAANGAGLSITHTEQSSFISPSNHVFHLKNLLHVPSVTKNLLTVSQFAHDNNIYFEFHPSFCLVKDQATGNILLKGLLQDGLYSFKLNASTSSSQSQSSVYHVSNPSSSSSTTNSSLHCKSNLDIWHNRLGHPSTLVITQVLKQYTISSQFNKNLSFCQACAIEKNHSLPFPTSSTTYTIPLQLIVSDLWGPSYKTSRNGYKYYISFIDAYSRFTWIYFLESKARAFSAFI